MSRITYIPLGTAEARDFDRVNDILADLASSTDPINHANLAEEGIDQAACDDNVHGSQRAKVSGSVRTVVAPQAFAMLTVGAGIRTGALGALEADHALRIRSMVRAESSLAAPAGFGFDNVNDLYEFRHAWNDGAATNTVEFSRHARGQIVQAIAYHGLHGVLMRESWLFGPIANIAWVELQYQNLGAGNMRADEARLTVTEFKMVTVT